MKHTVQGSTPTPLTLPFTSSAHSPRTSSSRHPAVYSVPLFNHGSPFSAHLLVRDLSSLATFHLTRHDSLTSRPSHCVHHTRMLHQPRIDNQGCLLWLFTSISPDSCAVSSTTFRLPRFVYTGACPPMCEDQMRLIRLAPPPLVILPSIASHYSIITPHFTSTCHPRQSSTCFSQN